MFRTIDRYMLRNLLPTAAVCFTSVLMLFVIIDAFSSMSAISRSAAEQTAFWSRLVVYYGARSTLECIRFGAVATLIAVSLTIYALGRNNELTAIRACGLSLRRCMLPMVFCGVAFSALCTLTAVCWTDNLTAVKNDGKKMLGKRVPALDAFAIQMQDGAAREFIFFADKVRRDGREAWGVSVVIDPPAGDRKPHLLIAAHAVWDDENTLWKLFDENGNPAVKRSLSLESIKPDIEDLLSLNPKNPAEAEKAWNDLNKLGPFRPVPSEAVSELVTKLTPGRIRVLGLRSDELSTSELLAHMDIKTASVEFHRRLTVSWAHLLMVLWGIPLMAVWGTRNPVFGATLALLLGIAFYSSSFMLGELALATDIPAAVCLWVPTILFIAAGIAAYMRMDTAS